MAIILLIVGLLVAAAGLVTVGFGIPISAFSLGNSLIVAGTTAFSAGIVLIGLASVLSQLRRIAAALNAPSRAVSTAESMEALIPPTAHMAPAPPQVSAPPRPLESREPVMGEPTRPQVRMPEPPPARPYAPAPAPNEPPGPLDWLRSKPKVASVTERNEAQHPGEPPMAEVTDEAPLSPRPTPRPPRFPAEPHAFEPKPRPHGSPEQRPVARPERPMPRFTPQVEPPHGGKNEFDVVWPDRSASAHAVEAGHRETAAEAPPPAPRPRETAFAERRAESAPQTTERGPAILKSGVIDGMPYTLYADGSIEAELQQGTVKFASVDALRAHLEGHG